MALLQPEGTGLPGWPRRRQHLGNDLYRLLHLDERLPQAVLDEFDRGREAERVRRAVEAGERKVLELLVLLKFDHAQPDLLENRARDVPTMALEVLVVVQECADGPCLRLSVRMEYQIQLVPLRPWTTSMSPCTSSGVIDTSSGSAPGEVHRLA